LSGGLSRCLRICLAACLCETDLDFACGSMQAYRPCPTAAAKGVRYSRVGQSLDEIVFKKNPKGGYCMCPARRHFASH